MENYESKMKIAKAIVIAGIGACLLALISNLVNKNFRRISGYLILRSLRIEARRDGI